MYSQELPLPIIDIEASGFGRGSYPIEVGVVLPDGVSYCTLIQRSPQWTHWDPRAEQLHHITVDQLAKYGKPPAEVAGMLNALLRGRIVYSDGWANDYSWLGLLFDEVEMTPAFKLENLRRILNEEEAARWHAAKDAELAVTPQQRHRASIDARVIQQTVARVRSSS